MPTDSDTQGAPLGTSPQPAGPIDPGTYLQAFRTRRDYCRTLLELSERQSDLIGRDDYTQLMDTLGQKQRVLGRMEELKPLWQNWPREKSLLEAGDRNACEELLAEAERVLVQLMASEKQSTDFLIERRNRTEAELRSLAEGSRVHEAYRDSLAPTARRRLDVDQ